MNPIDEAAEILKPTDKQFIIIAEGENNKGIELRQRFNYKRGMAMFAAVADSLMDDYVEKMGYTVHNDLRNVLEEMIRLNDKRPSNELLAKTLEKLQKLAKNAIRNESDELSQPKKENDIDNNVEDLIHALRCCAEINCVKCPRFIDEDEDGENKYTTLCNQALMIEAALMLEEFADGTRRSDDDQIC